jgi:Phosphorylase superfamily
MGPASLWEIEPLGVRLGVFHPGVGAPLAGAMLEQVIARGVRGVIACGAAGALVPELVMGHAVILTGAVRDEGDRPLPLHPVRRGGDGRRLAGRPGVAAPWVDDGQIGAPAVVRLGRGRRRRVDEVTGVPDATVPPRAIEQGLPDREKR